MGKTRIAPAQGRSSDGTTLTFAQWLARASDWLYRQGAVTEIHIVEIVYLNIVGVLLVLGWLGLVLAEFGRFSLVALSISTLPPAAIVILGLRSIWRSSPLSWSYDVLLAVPILVAAVALFTPPFEYIIGGADPGTYISTGANIANTGGIYVVDFDYLALSEDARAGLITLGQRLPGFYFDDYERGSIVPHGFHLYPTFLAIGHALGGINTNLWVTPVLALLAIMGFFLLVRRLFGSTVAVIAAIILILNVGTTWFARFPAAEVLVQFWLFAGLLAFILMLDRGSRKFALLAGLTLGAVHLTKIEEVALPVTLAAFFIYQWSVRRWRPEFSFFLVAYGLTIVHSGFHALLVSKFYFWEHLTLIFLRPLGFENFTMVYMTPGGRQFLGLVAVLFLLAGVGLVIGRNWVGRLLDDRRWVRSASVASGVFVLLLGAYAYYLRPPIAGLLPNLDGLTPGELNAVLDESSLTILGWYVSPIGLFLGILGFFVVLACHVSTRNAVLLGLAFLEGFVFLSDGRITPLHFWAARRYVPLIFPTFALFSACFLWWLQRSLRGRWPEAIAPAALGFVLLASTFGWLPFYGHVEFRGSIGQIDSLAKSVPEGSVLLFDDTHAGQTLAIPLNYLFGRTSIVPSKASNDSGVTRRLIEEFLAQGRTVFWIHAETQLLPQGAGVYIPITVDMPDFNRWAYDATLEVERTIELPLHVAATEHRPDTIDRMQYNLRIFRIVPKTLLGNSY